MGLGLKGGGHEVVSLLAWRASMIRAYQGPGRVHKFTVILTQGNSQDFSDIATGHAPLIWNN